MQTNYKQIRLIRATSDTSTNSINFEAFLLPRLANPEPRMKGAFLSHRCLSTLSERALYYSSLCSKHESKPVKKVDLIKEIKQKIAKITARKTLTDKAKPKKQFFGFKNIGKQLKNNDKTPELRVGREVLIEKSVKRKV